MSGIVLSASVRQNLLSLQSTADLLATTQNRLSESSQVIRNRLDAINHATLIACLEERRFLVVRAQHDVQQVTEVVLL